MDRTVPSFRMLVGIVEELSAFRRALHGEGRDTFDSPMNMARQHASSCTVAPLLDPMDAVFLSILIEQQKEINSLRASADGSSGNPDISNAGSNSRDFRSPYEKKTQATKPFINQHYI